MDFFSHQDQARRQTRRMVILFALAVAAIVIAVDLVVASVYLGTVSNSSVPGAAVQVPRALMLWSSLGTLALIAGGTIYRVWDLSDGGVAVAQMVGARRVDRDSRDPGERRFLNIVEEMALASGISVPQAYIMDHEEGINAFAAGYSPNEAVVAVTRGTLESLSRDELQGVIAHEFSHILNGDMRLNIHLLGVLNGIVLIGSIGLFLMRNAGRVRGSRDSGGIVLGLLAVGFALTAIGYIGVVFARVIKAAVSRQREYLADASAVQFTRNPEGIGGALVKIGQSTGLIANRHAEDLSHMYFGQAVKTAFAGLFATHPPLDERVGRVLGDRALLFKRMQAKRAAEAPQPVEEAEYAAPVSGFAGGSGAAHGAADTVADTAADRANEWGRRSGDALVNTTPGAVMASVGRPTTQHMEYARQMLIGFPAALRQAVGSVEGAKATLFALLSAAGGAAKVEQADLIRDRAGEAVAAQTLALAEALKPLGARARLPALDLAMPTLKAMPQSERDQLLALIKELIEADRRVTVSEFVMITICRRHLSREPKGGPPVKHKSVQTVAGEIAVILSLLLHAGKGKPEAFGQAMGTLGLGGQVLRTMAEVNFTVVEAALYELKLLAPLAKPAVIKACLAVVMAAGTLSVAQSELMRAICAALDTPLPPVLETSV